MNPIHLYIIACVSMVGLGLITGSLWKGFVYTVWISACLGFWWAVWLAIHALVS